MAANNNTQKVVKVKAPKNATEFIEQYCEGTLSEDRKYERWSTYWWGGLIVLEYTVPEKVTVETWRNTSTRTEPKHEIVAYRLPDGSVLSNANTLEYAGVKMAWGKRIRNWGQNDIQILLEKCGAAPLPFTLFRETGMDARDFAWVVKPVAEKVSIKRMEQVRQHDGTYKEQPAFRTQHFVGACVFAIGEDHYLFDVDRQELDHNIFNPFVTKLPVKVSSIAEAYDVLIPEAVKKTTSEVKRQGEFFFIKHSDEFPIVKAELTEEEKQIIRFRPSRFGFEAASEVDTYSDGREYASYEMTNGLTPAQQEFQDAMERYNAVLNKQNSVRATRGDLGKSSSASHKVEKFVKDGETTYVSGKVSQSRRQHADLILEGWYIVVPNTGVISWTVTGDID